MSARFELEIIKVAIEKIAGAIERLGQGGSGLAGAEPRHQEQASQGRGAGGLAGAEPCHQEQAGRSDPALREELERIGEVPTVAVRCPQEILEACAKAHERLNNEAAERGALTQKEIIWETTYKALLAANTGKREEETAAWARVAAYAIKFMEHARQAQ